MLADHPTLHHAITVALWVGFIASLAWWRLYTVRQELRATPRLTCNHDGVNTENLPDAP